MGTEIKPEKETALPIEEISFKIRVSRLIEYWNKIRKNKEIKIEYIIFIIKSLKLELYTLNTFKNSTGINKIKIDVKNNIKNQNKPCPVHEIIFLSVPPIDSSNK